MAITRKSQPDGQTIDPRSRHEYLRKLQFSVAFSTKMLAVLHLVSAILLLESVGTFRLNLYHSNWVGESSGDHVIAYNCMRYIVPFK